MTTNAQRPYAGPDNRPDTRPEIRPDPPPQARRRPDQDRARNWLQRQLEWEEILGALRGAGRSRERCDPPDEESAAA